MLTFKTLETVPRELFVSGAQLKKRRKWGRKGAWGQGEKGSSSFLLCLLSLRFCIFSRRSHRKEVVEESEVNGSFLLALFLHTLSRGLSIDLSRALL